MWYLVFRGLPFVVCLFACASFSKPADFSVVYTGKVYLNDPQTYSYNLTRNNISGAVRVKISAENVSEEYPLIAVIKQQTGVLSFPLPFIINSRFPFNVVSRTLCPSFIARNNRSNATEQIVVELSSSVSNKSLAPFYRLRLDVLHNFLLPLGEVVRLLITPSEPQYFLFSLPDDVDSVVVRARSTDTLCMTVSVQHAKCPVADTLGSVKYSGVYQTVTTRGAIPISKIQENVSDFLVVLVLRPEDVDCDGIATVVKPAHQPLPRIKNVTISVSPTLAGYHYYLPIYGAVGIYVLFYIAAAVIILLYRSYDKQVTYYLGYPSGLTTHTDPRNAPNATPPPPLANFVQFASDDPITCARQLVDSGSSLMLAPRAVTSASIVVGSTHRMPLHQSRSFFSSSSSFEFSNSDDSTKRLRKFRHRVSLSPLQRAKHHRRTVSYGSTRDTAVRRTGSLVERCAACSMLNVRLEAGDVLPMVVQGEGSRTNNESRIDVDALREPKLDKHRNLYVSDLSRKHYSTLDRKYLLYFWYLIIISIFYGLPVIQLVMTYQRALHDTGNEDMCYYNFECAHPLGLFTAFNNIISNIGYVMLGLLFLGLTARRDLMYRRSQKFKTCDNQAYGIPQHYGLFYAMGLALTMEGVLSACYHICPSFSNFQFDTAYMYILALILMLKIYQTRHPDINASAHSAYMVMAIVILAGVTGVVYGGETFWVVFTIVFLTMSIWLTAEIYYMGHWSFDICLPRRLYNLLRSDGIHYLVPMHLERMLLLLVANIVNIGMAVFGLFTRPRDFSSYLLSIFMINLLMYYFFYVIMKCRFRERFHCVPLLFIVLACLTWSSAIYFFLQHSTTWEVTPAQSRALNQPCILLGFYDVHDVWHFLSSTSMFFSFMSIMTLDDDLTDTPRDAIPVF